IAAREKAKEATCLLNVQTLGNCLQDLLGEHHIRFALTANTFRKALTPYIRRYPKGTEETVFHCPMDAPGSESYSFNPNLDNRSIARFDADHLDAVVMVYEGAN